MTTKPSIRSPMRCTAALVLGIALAQASTAAPRSPEQARQEQAWLDGVASDLRAAARTHKARDGSSQLRPFEHARFAYDPTSVAHVIVGIGIGGVTVHVSSGWIALAADAALARKVAESTRNPACSVSYLKTIAPAIRANLDYELGAATLPRAIDRFHAYVEDDGDSACHDLAVAPWHDSWRPRGLEASQQMEAGLTWWIAVDLLCMPRSFDTRRCPIDGVEDHEALAMLDQLGIPDGRLRAIRELRVLAFIDSKAVAELAGFTPPPATSTP